MRYDPTCLDLAWEWHLPSHIMSAWASIFVGYAEVAQHGRDKQQPMRRSNSRMITARTQKSIAHLTRRSRAHLNSPPPHTLRNPSPLKAFPRKPTHSTNAAVGRPWPKSVHLGIRQSLGCGNWRNSAPDYPALPLVDSSIRER